MWPFVTFYYWSCTATSMQVKLRQQFSRNKNYCHLQVGVCNVFIHFWGKFAANAQWWLNAKKMGNLLILCGFLDHERNWLVEFGRIKTKIAAILLLKLYLNSQLLSSRLYLCVALEYREPHKKLWRARYDLWSKGKVSENDTKIDKKSEN